MERFGGALYALCLTDIVKQSNDLYCEPMFGQGEFTLYRAHECKREKK